MSPLHEITATIPAALNWMIVDFADCDSDGDVADDAAWQEAHNAVKTVNESDVIRLTLSSDAWGVIIEEIETMIARDPFLESKEDESNFRKSIRKERNALKSLLAKLESEAK